MDKLEFLRVVFPDQPHVPKPPGYVCFSSLVGPCPLVDNFQALHFVQLPVNLDNEFTWVIRRGHKLGYGYLLDRPLDDLAAASDLVKRLMAHYGAVDVFDLPTGYGYSPDHHNQLLEWHPENKWAAADLLKGVPEIVQGANPYRPHKYEFFGVVDSLLEFLHEKGFLIEEHPRHFRVTCPFSAEHFGQASTWYTPGKQHFECHDPACKGRRPGDYLHELFLQGGPAFPTSGAVDQALSRWARAPDFWIDLKTGVTLAPNQFKALFSHSISVPCAFRRWRVLPAYKAITGHPALLRLFGTVHAENRPPVIDADGISLLNLSHGLTQDKPASSDPLVNAIESLLAFCDQKMSGLVLPNDLVNALETVCAETQVQQVHGPGWPQLAKKLIRARTDTLCRAFREGQFLYFRTTRTNAGFLMARQIGATHHQKALDFWPTSARGDIIVFVNQWVERTN